MGKWLRETGGSLKKHMGKEVSMFLERQVEILSGPVALSGLSFNKR